MLSKQSGVQKYSANVVKIMDYQKKRNEILIRRGVQKALAERFGVGRKAVREALGGITRSEIADKIRAVALAEFGGAEVK